MFVLWMSAKAFHFPFQMEFTEGTTAYGAYRVALGEPLYTDLSSPPFVVFGYPPVFYFLTGKAAALTHLPVLSIGRLFSLLSGLGVFLVIFWLGGRTLLSFLSATAFLLNPFFMQELLLCQPNTMALFFGLLSVASALKGKKTLAFSLATLSLFTKPLFLALPLTALVLLQRKRKSLLCLLLFFLLQVCLFFLLNGQTKGAAIDHLFYGHRQPFRFEQVFTFFKLHLRFLFPLLILFPFLRAQHSFLRELVFFSLIPVLLSAKEGASPVYFSEALIGLHLAFSKLEIRLPTKFFIVQLVFFVFFSIFFFRTSNIVYAFSSLTHTILVSKAPLLRMVASVKGRVLTEDADLSFLAGKPWIYEPFNARTLFSIRRKSIHPLQKMLKQGKIRFVIAGNRLMADPFLKPYLGRAFVPFMRLAHFTVFRFRANEKN